MSAFRCYTTRDKSPFMRLYHWKYSCIKELTPKEFIVSMQRKKHSLGAVGAPGKKSWVTQDPFLQKSPGANINY